MEIIGRLAFNVLLSVIATFLILGSFAVLVNFEWFQNLAESLLVTMGLLE